MVNSSKYAQSYKFGRTFGWFVSAVLLFVVIGPMIQECSKMPGTPELQVGQRIVFQMAGRENVRQVSFFESYPDALPSNFVTMVADENHPLWPGKAQEQAIHEQLDTPSNRILRPEGLEFSSWERRFPQSDEIVLNARDEEQKLVVTGYVGGESEPAFEYVWDFPTTAGKIPIR